MAVTDTDTVLQICTDALRESGVVAIDEEASAAEFDVAVRHLNRMMKAWQNKGWNLWTRATLSTAATTSASYTLTPARPHRITSVRWKSVGGQETPMVRMTADEYDTLPNKAATGTPTSWYFDRQREAAKLYVWPVPASVTTETLEISYHREIEDMASSDTIDAPGEWYEAIVTSLALRLCNSFGVQPPPTLPPLAAGALADALADDREGSVFMGECYGD